MEGQIPIEMVGYSGTSKYTLQETISSWQLMGRESHLHILTSVIGSAGLGWSGLCGRLVGETAVRAAPKPFFSFELEMMSFMSSLFFCGWQRATAATTYRVNWISSNSPQDETRPFPYSCPSSTQCWWPDNNNNNIITFNKWGSSVKGI